jgi:hypothetical protein
VKACEEDDGDVGTRPSDSHGFPLAGAGLEHRREIQGLTHEVEGRYEMIVQQDLPSKAGRSDVYFPCHGDLRLFGAFLLYRKPVLALEALGHTHYAQGVQEPAAL